MPSPPYELQKVQCKKAGCERIFRIAVSRGLKTSRLCPACRLAERLRKKAQVRVRTSLNAKAPAGQYDGSSGRKKTSQSRLKCDHAATKAANFLDSRSYIHISGRFILAGKDMSAQRQKVWERDKGICGICGKPCHASYWDLDHIIPRSKGHDSRASNLQILCRPCHREKHGRTIQWTRSQP